MESIETALAAIRNQYETSCADAARIARARLTAELNQMARQLRQYESEDEWVSALADGALLFASEIAVVAVEGGNLRLRATRGMEADSGSTFSVESAPAFSHAISSEEMVIALRSEREVGPPLSSGEERARAFLFPIHNAERIAAVLFAAGPEPPDPQGLELLANVASLALSKTRKQSGLTALGAGAPKKAAAPVAGRELPPWSALGEEQRNLHLRAQRFARVKVAEMIVKRPEACRAGFEQNDVYLFLKKEIDAARESYRMQFLRPGPMIDYLHLELVRAAGEGDESKLGGEYPGPLD